MSLLLLVIGVFLGGLGFGILAGWVLRGEYQIARQVTGKTVDFTRRKVGT